jgi:hypothetical protein
MPTFTVPLRLGTLSDGIPQPAKSNGAIPCNEARAKPALPRRKHSRRVIPLCGGRLSEGGASPMTDEKLRRVNPPARTLSVVFVKGILLPIDSGARK